MTAIERLEIEVKKQYPTAKYDIDKPGKEIGSWFLDIDHEDYEITVEWQQGKGFGLVAGKRIIYGRVSDEVILGTKTMIARVCELLRTKESTGVEEL